MQDGWSAFTSATKFLSLGAASVSYSPRVVHQAPGKDNTVLTRQKGDSGSHLVRLPYFR